MTKILSHFPEPFHVCDVLQDVREFQWFHPNTGESIHIATDREVRAFAEARCPQPLLLLSTMHRFSSDRWTGPDVVAIAVCDRATMLHGRATVSAFIVGGYVPKGTVIPPEHGPESGCIPFDMDVWPDLVDTLPRRPTLSRRPN